MMPGAALFDLDGTLVDSEARHRRAWARLFAAHDVPLDGPTLDGFAGRAGRDVLAEHRAAFPGCTVEELADESVRLWAQEGPSPQVPGAVGLLHRAAAVGAGVAVVSSGARALVESELAGLGVLDLVDVVVTAEDVERRKPDPEGYRLALSRLGVAPSEGVVFEDVPAGVRAGRRAGCRCVAVATTVAADRLGEADLVVPDLTGVGWPVFA